MPAVRRPELAQVRALERALARATDAGTVLAREAEARLRRLLPGEDADGRIIDHVGPLRFRLDFANVFGRPGGPRILLLRRWMEGDDDMLASVPVLPLLANSPASLEAHVVLRLLPPFLRAVGRARAKAGPIPPARPRHQGEHTP